MTITDWSPAFQYTLIDQKLSVGIEMEFVHEKARNSSAEVQFLIGPSLQWRPTAWSHLDVVPLIGCTHDSPRVEAFLVFGIDFGTGTKKGGQYIPASLRTL